MATQDLIARAVVTSDHAGLTASFRGEGFAKASLTVAGTVVLDLQGRGFDQSAMAVHVTPLGDASVTLAYGQVGTSLVVLVLVGGEAPEGIVSFSVSVYDRLDSAYTA